MQRPVHPRRRRDLVAQPVGDERVVYDPRSDNVHVLGPAAATVWDALGAECDRTELLARLAACEPSLVGDEVGAELERVLDDLQRAGLLAVEPAPDASPLAPPEPPANASDAEPASVAETVRAALVALAAGDAAGAERLLRRGLAKRPDDPDLLGNLASVLFLAGGSDEPAALYERALERAPQRADLWSNLGNVRRRQGRDDEAASCYARALEIVPEHLDAACNFGALRAAQGRDAEAIALWRGAAERSPAATTPVVSEARLHTERGERARAAEVLRAALTTSPSNPELWNALGVVLALDERRDEAMASFERASELRPTHAAAARNLLQLAAAAERWSDVERHAARLADALPDLAEIPVVTARARLATGRREEAIDALREGLARRATALACAEELVRFHERAGDRAEALLAYAAVAKRFEALQLERWPRLAALHRRASELRARQTATPDA